MILGWRQGEGIKIWIKKKILIRANTEEEGGQALQLGEGGGGVLNMGGIGHSERVESNGSTNIKKGTKSYHALMLLKFATDIICVITI